MGLDGFTILKRACAADPTYLRQHFAPQSSAFLICRRVINRGTLAVGTIEYAWPLATTICTVASLVTEQPIVSVRDGCSGVHILRELYCPLELETEVIRAMSDRLTP
jgi:hypothetical protein